MDSTIARKRRRQGMLSRKGGMFVTVGIMIMIMFAAAVFSVDLAYVFLAREQLHVATDAAAKAAVVGLSQGHNQQVATGDAISCAGSNTVCAKPLAISASNVTMGNVSFTPSWYWTFHAGSTPTAAAQVSAHVSVPLFFAPLFHIHPVTISNTSTAAFVRNKWCFVFDRSGSMEYDMSGVEGRYPPGRNGNMPPDPVLSRWANLQPAAQIFLNAVKASPVDNMVGMVTFHDNATTDCALSLNYQPITDRLTYYGANVIAGSTNLAAGLTAAFNLFAASDDGTPWNKIIIVFSDGQSNVPRDPLYPLQLVDPTKPNYDPRSAGVVVHAIGLLPDANNDTMRGLPALTGGMFFFAVDSATLQAAFQRLAQTLPVILTQ
jgi:Ca-activated chloride channel homolog